MQFDLPDPNFNFLEDLLKNTKPESNSNAQDGASDHYGAKSRRASQSPRRDPSANILLQPFGGAPDKGESGPESAQNLRKRNHSAVSGGRSPLEEQTTGFGDLQQVNRAQSPDGENQEADNEDELDEFCETSSWETSSERSGGAIGSGTAGEASMAATSERHG